jgi:ankyrin repeat protein
VQCVPAVDDTLFALMQAIAGDNRDDVARYLQADPGLASARFGRGASRQQPVDYFFTEIRHYVYRGDTALHIAAAAWATDLTRELGALGADVRAVNRRGAQPLHYAVDGGPSERWDPDAQAATVKSLIGMGADVDAADKNGTTPLLRAIRNRSAPAVAALLDAGANRHATNKRGSTAQQLAAWTTGKSGSGSPAARAQQEEIIRLLQQ